MRDHARCLAGEIHSRQRGHTALPLGAVWDDEVLPRCWVNMEDTLYGPVQLACSIEWHSSSCGCLFIVGFLGNNVSFFGYRVCVVCLSEVVYDMVRHGTGAFDVLAESRALPGLGQRHVLPRLRA